MKYNINKLQQGSNLPNPASKINNPIKKTGLDALGLSKDQTSQQLGTSPTTSGIYFTKELDPVYRKYKPYFENYLKRFAGTKLKGDDLATSFSDFLFKNPKVNPTKMAPFVLAQTQLETKAGTIGRGGKPGENNPFNVGEYDNRTAMTFNNPKQGIDAYFNLLAKSYLPRVNWDPNGLISRKNYVDIMHRRYASNPNYENLLKNQIQVINKRNPIK